jgi:hypothetical protein
MTKVTALRALYAALGGESADAAVLGTEAELIYAVAEAVDELLAGGTLPEVSADDNGKLLKVVDGEWAAASAN